MAYESNIVQNNLARSFQKWLFYTIIGIGN